MKNFQKKHVCGYFGSWLCICWVCSSFMFCFTECMGWCFCLVRKKNLSLMDMHIHEAKISNYMINFVKALLDYLK